MRAVLCSAFTGPEDLRIGEIEEPKPASDEILIDVHAASVSFMDHLLVSGLYQMRPSTPFDTYFAAREAARINHRRLAERSRYKRANSCLRHCSAA